MSQLHGLRRLGALTPTRAVTLLIFYLKANLRHETDSFSRVDFCITLGVGSSLALRDLEISMCPILSTVSSWFRANEFVAIWLEGLALLAIFIWDRWDSYQQHTETLAQMEIMQSQANAAKDAAEAANANAEAAKLNAQAVLNSERAWVEIKLGPPLPPDYRDQDQDTSTDVFECSIQIENHGRTIAHVETIQIGADCVSGPFPQEPSNFTTKNLHSILGSGQKETISGWTANSFLEWRAILDRAKRGILRITVKYRDVVGTSIRHETSVVYVFQNSLEDEPEKVSSLSVYT